ncbi:MAG: amidohydrolase family protein [Treponema sp.]|nr:amidohydrolase family protein [Treponema sp.]
MIDFHVHITPPDIISDCKKYAEKEPYFSLLFYENTAFANNRKFASAEDIVAALEHEDSYFDKAVVFGFAFRDIGLCRYVNDYVIESVKKYPHRLIGFCVVPPHIEASKEIERCYNAGLKGVGELFPAGQDIDLEDKDNTLLITDTCKEMGLPLLLHVNEQVGHQYKGKTTVPLKHIETFVVNNPEIKIVLAHWGGGLMFYETMPEIKESFRNVYYDTAASPFLYDMRIYDTVKALGLCNKVLFGSDFPLLPQSKYMEAINNSVLSHEEKQMIMSDNALKLIFPQMPQ